MNEGRQRTSGRHPARTSFGQWGWLTPALAESLRAAHSRDLTEVKLLAGVTSRSFGLAILAQLAPAESRRMSTPQLWSTLLARSTPSLRTLIIHGFEHICAAGDRIGSRRSEEIRDAFLLLLMHDIRLVIVGPDAGARFLLQDFQLRARCRGMWNSAGGQLQ